jgi:hypothetical protein
MKQTNTLKRLNAVLTLGYNVCATTIRKVLDAHGIVPDPEHRKRGDWMQFIETQQYVAAATDFATVEVLTGHGLIWEHLLFFMDSGSREVRFGGIIHSPTATGQRRSPGTCVICGTASCSARNI